MSKLHRWALLDKSGKTRNTCTTSGKANATYAFKEVRKNRAIPKGWRIVDRGPVEDDTLALAADPAPVPEATPFTTKNEDGITINGQFYWVHPKVQEYIYALEEACYGPDAKGIKAEVDRLKAELEQERVPGQIGDYIQQLRKEATEAAAQERERIRPFFEELIDNIEIPERNCLCHISPPCGDCVEYAGLRETVSALRAALEPKPEVPR